jgi:hypothetical protein
MKKLLIFGILILGLFLIGCAEDMSDADEAELESDLAELSAEELDAVIEAVEADDSAALAGQAGKIIYKKYVPKTSLSKANLLRLACNSKLKKVIALNVVTPTVIDPNAVEICNDNIDNNGDGLIDCDDPYCWSEGWNSQCWTLPDQGVSDVHINTTPHFEEGAPLEDTFGKGLLGHRCAVNDDCVEGWCVFRNNKHPYELGSFCTTTCVSSCPVMGNNGAVGSCNRLMQFAPDVVSICTTPYAATN